jgi:hypothetical protein
VAEISAWDVAVESWDAGELQLITEDRGLGYVTREVRPTTAVTTIQAGAGQLRPWLAHEALGPDVSGVGDYRATARLDDLGSGRLLLDLGSTAGGLGSVSINGAAARGFDTSRPIVDITNDLRAGDNTFHVRVSSSLNNRLLARGYYDRVPDIMLQLTGGEGTQQTEPHPHGLLGPVRLLREVP